MNSMNIINTTTLDPNFKYELAEKPGAEQIKKCFACGTCTAGCPVFHVEHAYNPRKLIRMILLGMRKEVLQSDLIWLCAQCYICSANCPQNVDFSSIILTLRHLAVQEGYAPPDRLEKINTITTAAHAFRKHCINLLLGQEGITEAQIRESAEQAIKQVMS